MPLHRNLTFDQLLPLLQTVFDLRQERGLTFLVDLPNSLVPDTPTWKDRRHITFEWYRELFRHLHRTPFTKIDLCLYENVGSNNSDLPPQLLKAGPSEEGIREQTGSVVTLEEILAASSVILAPTEFSATAPLKVLAKKFGFRGATLPGFTREMIPALGLDYEQINERVLEIKRRMDAAESADLLLAVAQQDYMLSLDLRFRTAHASGGIIRTPGTVANLPSGEAYIVPYEGERVGERSKSAGLLPVQFGEDIVVFNIRENRALGLITSNTASVQQKNLLAEEPAYGNIAELGIGVLGEWGVQATGSTLVDEKLGLHVAFGRSDHFDGATSPKSFRNPKNVIHIDWVYVPSVQPLVTAKHVIFHYQDGGSELILSGGKLVA